MDPLELTHLNKNQRVCIFKLPPLSTSKGFYLDDWKQMIWEGGCKVTEKSKVLTITFISKDGKVFAQTNVPNNYKDAIQKTQDSSRGYAVRLEKPGGGYLWVGTVFRDRNDAFDFGAVFQTFAQQQKINTNPNALKQQFGDDVDFSLKKGQKVKININPASTQKTGNSTQDFFNEFNFQSKPSTQQKKTEVKKGGQDWFADFGMQPKKKQEKPKAPDFNLLDL